MISWSFIRGILVTVLFLVNLKTEHPELGILALCSLILLFGVEAAGRNKIEIRG